MDKDKPENTTATDETPAETTGGETHTSEQGPESDAVAAIKAAFEAAGEKPGEEAGPDSDGGEGEQEEEFEPIPGPEIDDAAIKIGLVGHTQDDDDDKPAPGSIEASLNAHKAKAGPETKPETKAEAKAEAAVALLDEDALNQLAEDVAEVKPLVDALKAVTALAQKQKERLDDYDRQIAESKSAVAKAKAEEAAFEAEIAPILRAIDAIPDLDEAKYGVFGSRGESKMTHAQFQARVALDTAAGKLRTQWEADGKEFSPAQIYEAAHRKLRGPAPKPRAAPNHGETERLHKTRSAAGLATGGKQRTTPIFTAQDSGPEAMAKAFKAATS